MLEPLGLDATTESVYRALLQRPEWSLTDIAEHLSLGEAEVRDRLDRLAELSLLRPSVRRLEAPRPVSPDVGLVKLLAHSQEDLATRQRQIGQMREAIASISEEYHATSPLEHTFVRLEGVDAVRARLAELAHLAHVECLSFLPNGAQNREAMDSSGPLDELALSRDITVRSVYQESFRNDPNTLRYVRWLTHNGGQTRTVAVLPLQLVIVDRTTALVPLEPDNPRDGALEITNGGVVTALIALFEQTWESATPFGEELAPHDTDGLSRQDRALLRLLAEGHTDERAARRLGMSLRTVRRMTAVLLDRLGAQSRFQAGVRASRRGWL